MDRANSWLAVEKYAPGGSGGLVKMLHPPYDQVVFGMPMDACFPMQSSKHFFMADIVLQYVGEMYQPYLVEHRSQNLKPDGATYKTKLRRANPGYDQIKGKLSGGSGMWAITNIDTISPPGCEPRPIRDADQSQQDGYVADEAYKWDMLGGSRGGNSFNPADDFNQDWMRSSVCDVFSSGDTHVPRYIRLTPQNETLTEIHTYGEHKVPLFKIEVAVSNTDPNTPLTWQHLQHKWKDEVGKATDAGFFMDVVYSKAEYHQFWLHIPQLPEDLMDPDTICINGLPWKNKPDWVCVYTMNPFFKKVSYIIYLKPLSIA